jgi:hypothetical protein
MSTCELERLHHHYADLTDDALLGAFACGPDSYATREVWRIIEGEAKSRGLTPEPVVSLVSGSPSRSSLPAIVVPAFGDLPGDGTRYAVYGHPDGRRQAVKRGFSWPGFLFTWIWAFAKGLHDWGTGVLVASVVIMVIGRSPELVPALLALAAAIGLRLMVGSGGNAARERALVASHWQLLGTVPSATPEEALAKAQADQQP